MYNNRGYSCRVQSIESEKFVFDTKNNHFVPRSYLDKFTSDNLFKLLKSDKKIFSISNLSSECSKKHLYTVREKISDDLVNTFCQTMRLGELGVSITKQLKMFLNADFNDYLDIKILEDNLEAQKEIDRIISKLQIFVNESKTQEELFSLIYEEGFFNFINIINEDVTKIKDLLSLRVFEKKESLAYYLIKYQLVFGKFYSRLIAFHLDYPEKNEHVETLISGINKESDEKEPFLDVLMYLFIQHYRTNVFINSLKNMLIGLKEEEKRNFIFLSIHILSLYQAVECSSYDRKVCFIIKNETIKKFITSDNPSCFLNSKNSLTIIMPLNEEKMIVFSTKRSHFNKRKQSTYYVCNSEKFVNYINKIIFKNADKCVYGSKNMLQYI